MKVSDLIGAELDYWVARAIGKRRPTLVETGFGKVCYVDSDDRVSYDIFNPSENWQDAGQIIEKYRINLTPQRDDGKWYAFITEFDRGIYGNGYGDTALIAAMRACIASKCGIKVSDKAIP